MQLLYLMQMDLLSSIGEWWQLQSITEVIAVITGLACVYLAAKNNIWNWPFAIISVSIYIVIFYEARLFADMCLQFYFLAMNIYGWHYWSRNRSNESKTPVSLISKREILLSAAAILAVTLLLGSVLKYTTASLPYIDSFCAACSIVAQVFLARKVLENWLIWVFVDAVYVGVYVYKDLYLTAIMYAIY
ncbi:nicotinamide riboside transporter PnuC [Mucilaginibacter limnophilus]|uniref:nicotinamide riboside transporter PnuC n=1 Tax=Mucilaginibacter limnophilus TaxID=1932778 RepID=UPI001F0B88F7|nr:nicotinamide riboside transporter PnuC [Mucilaginibacter limnophilus]